MEGSTYLRQAGKRERERAQSGRRPPLIVYIYVQESRVIDDARRASAVSSGRSRLARISARKYFGRGCTQGTGDPRQCTVRGRETRGSATTKCIVTKTVKKVHPSART